VLSNLFWTKEPKNEPATAIAASVSVLKGLIKMTVQGYR
jgi:hypothetical protein